MSDCGKCAYPSRASALRIARRQMRNCRGLELRAYFCNACGHWHLTSQENKFRHKRDDED